MATYEICKNTIEILDYKKYYQGITLHDTYKEKTIDTFTNLSVAREILKAYSPVINEIETIDGHRNAIITEYYINEIIDEINGIYNLVDIA